MLACRDRHGVLLPLALQQLLVVCVLLVPLLLLLQLGVCGGALLLRHRRTLGRIISQLALCCFLLGRVGNGLLIR